MAYDGPGNLQRFVRHQKTSRMFLLGNGSGLGPLVAVYVQGGGGKEETPVSEEMSHVSSVLRTYNCIQGRSQNTILLSFCSTNALYTYCIVLSSVHDWTAKRGPVQPQLHGVHVQAKDA